MWANLQTNQTIKYLQMCFFFPNIWSKLELTLLIKGSTTVSDLFKEGRLSLYGQWHLELDLKQLNAVCQVSAQSKAVTSDFQLPYKQETTSLFKHATMNSWELHQKQMHTSTGQKNTDDSCWLGGLFLFFPSPPKYFHNFFTEVDKSIICTCPFAKQEKENWWAKQQQQEKITK